MATKGKTWLESGYVYAPYVPMVSNYWDILINPGEIWFFRDWKKRNVIVIIGEVKNNNVYGIAIDIARNIISDKPVDIASNRFLELFRK